MNAVDILHLNQRYGSLAVLHDVSLQLHEGEVLGLFGHNGAGKTTCMKLILGLLSPSEGKVEVLGGNPRELHVRSQLGYLPENMTFYPQLTGRETLHHFARLKGAPARQVEALLEQVGLTQAMDRRVKTYSKGMRQRLGLAQALLGQPRLLLLDEPTVGLDPIATQTLYRLVDELRRGGTSVILCSHILAGIEPYLNRAAILAAGRFQVVGNLAQLRARAGLPVSIRLSGLADGDKWMHHWDQAGHACRRLDQHQIEIKVQATHQHALLHQLLEVGGLADMEIHPPSLEDLYCYFMTRANQAEMTEATP